MILSVGGAQEAMKSKPGEYKIYLKKRKGFIKVVLETGASLVPVFSFGEGKKATNCSLDDLSLIIEKVFYLEISLLYQTLNKSYLHF